MIDLLATLDRTLPDWTVDCLPLHHSRGTIPDYSALVRSDTGQTMEIVHGRREPIQNHQAVALAKALGHDFQGVRITNDGCRVVMVFNTGAVSFAGDDLSLHLCLLNQFGHSTESSVGRSSRNRHTPGKPEADGDPFLSAHLAYRRIACMNVFDSLWYQRGQTLSINPADSDAPGQLREWIECNVKESLGQAQRLLDTPISRGQLAMFAMDHFRERDSSIDLATLWETAPDLEPIRGTAWGAYQAVAAYLTHHHRSSYDWWLEGGHYIQQRAVRFFSAEKPVHIKWDPRRAYSKQPD